MALTVWIGDGSNFPGHKMYEPAFYSTVVQDWGSSYLTATELGPKALCLVDLGHHAPNVNIEMIVARLVRAGKLGGFHFNDSKYGDDDLDAGSIDPNRLFLIFNELVELEGTPGLDLAHMIDQSHNVTDPIESLMISAYEIQRAYVQASLVDRTALEGFRSENDALMASATLRSAFRTDVEPILAMARLRQEGAIDLIMAYRRSWVSRQGRKHPAEGHWDGRRDRLAAFTRRRPFGPAWLTRTDAESVSLVAESEPLCLWQRHPAEPVPRVGY